MQAKKFATSGVPEHKHSPFEVLQGISLGHGVAEHALNGFGVHYPQMYSNGNTK